MNREWSAKMKKALSEKEPADLKGQMERMVKLADVQLGQSKRKRIGFWELLMRQVNAVGWRIWGMEAAAAFFGSFVLGCLLKDPYFFTPRKIAFYLSCGTVTASMLLLPVLYRSIRFRMIEVESAAYFSYKRLLVSRFLLFFAGEVAGMGVMGVIAYGRQLMSGSMLIYVLVPMLLTGEGILIFLKRSSPDKLCVHYACYDGALLLLLCVVYRAVPQIYDGKYGSILMAAGMILLGCSIRQCMGLVKQPEEALYV